MQVYYIFKLNKQLLFCTPFYPAGLSLRQRFVFGASKFWDLSNPKPYSLNPKPKTLNPNVLGCWVQGFNALQGLGTLGFFVLLPKSEVLAVWVACVWGLRGFRGFRGFRGLQGLKGLGRYKGF